MNTIWHTILPITLYTKPHLTHLPQHQPSAISSGKFSANRNLTRVLSRSFDILAELLHFLQLVRLPLGKFMGHVGGFSISEASLDGAP